MLYWGQLHLLLSVPRHQRRANIFKLAHHLLTVARYVRGGTFDYKTSLWIMGLYKTRLILKPSNGTQTSRPFPLVKNTAGNSETLDIQQVLHQVGEEVAWSMEALAWKMSYHVDLAVNRLNAMTTEEQPTHASLQDAIVPRKVSSTVQEKEAVNVFRLQKAVQF